jgi:hypothetical protein
MSKLDKSGARHNDNTTSIPKRPEVDEKRSREGHVSVSKTALPNKAKSSLSGRPEIDEKVAGKRHIWGAEKEFKHLKVGHFHDNSEK